ncbi:MAG: alpha-hydroxy acid oxidase [Steroidobacteraceae bacterium]
MTSLHTIEAMRQAAKRRLPRFAFDFIDGGAGRESALKVNAAAFDSVRLWPRVLSGTTDRTQAVDLLGHRYSAPFGVAPIGMANLISPGTDSALARAADVAGIVYVLSTAGTTALEEIAAECHGAWFQLYIGQEASITDDLIDRAEAANLDVLVVTVDVPAPGKRIRDLNNGFTLPLRPSLRMAADLFCHPLWMLRIILGGAPQFENLARYGRSGASATSVAELMARQSSARLNWRLLESIRSRWQGRFVLKGVLCPDDALRAARIGADAVIVSNHGGRQLDASPATLDALRLVRKAVGTSVKLILDGGVRSGEDVARALALGADFVLLGRPFLYAVAALGLECGPRQLIAQLTDEFDRALAQLGCSNPSSLRSLINSRDMHCAERQSLRESWY